MRLLVCGSRSYQLDFLLPAIIGTYNESTRVVLIQGGATGADWHARQFGYRHGMRVKTFNADWDECVPECRPGHRKERKDGSWYCTTAGLRRNQRMLDEGKPDLVLAFVDKPLAESRGTADMVQRARAAGVPTYVIEKVA